MAGTDPLDDVQARFSAEQRIVDATHCCLAPSIGDVQTWLRGGAVFWSENHWFVAWGLLLRDNFDEEAIIAHPQGLRGEIAENWGTGTLRQKFGSIPLRNAAGLEAVAITAFDDMWGDKLFHFFPNIDDFVSRAPMHGWLLAQQPDFSDSLARLSDEELMAIWSHETDQPFL